ARFTSRLPDRWVVRHGIHKWILREALAGKVPDPVRWRKGKEHLGLAFNLDLLLLHRETMKAEFRKDSPLLATVLDGEKLLRILAESEGHSSVDAQFRLLDLSMLRLWRRRVDTLLQQNQQR
ncbi:MAG: asparagine synthase-related protein, partial [Verrucomicrobiota bacterium]